VNRLTRATALPATIVLVGPPALPAAPQTARSLYAAAKSSEEALRDAAKKGRPEPTLANYRSVISAYEAVSRRFPATGYADNALWQGAILSLDALERFGDERDRRTARRLLQALVDRYPSSSLSPKGRAEMERLTTAPQPAPPAAKPAVSPAPPPVAAKAAPSPASPATTASAAPAPNSPLLEVRQIRRTQNADGVRVTIEVEREVDFRSERLENPPRVLFDLPGTLPGEAILQGTLSYPDGVVRYIRVGRQPNDVTRVVLDLTGASRYSSFTLYDPYRIVIDCEAERPAPVPTQQIGEEPLAPPVPDPAPPRLMAEKPSQALLPPAAAPSSSNSPPEKSAGTPPPKAPSPKPVPPPVARAPLSSRRLPQPYSTLPLAGGWRASELRPPLPSRRVKLAWVPGLAVPVLGDRAAIEMARSAEAAPSLAKPPAVAAKPASTSAADKPGVTNVVDKPSPGGAASSPSLAPTPIAPAPLAGGFSLARQLGLGVARVVIDPGHGGHDPGALGPGITEAKVVVDVALRLENLLKAAGVDVVLTRRTDEYLPPEERTRVANEAQGDLFISIHANASRNKKAQGVETYVLNFASNPEAEAVAARENAASTGTMSNLAGIVRAITLNNKLDESRGLAASVQTQLLKKLKGSRAHGPGVKQAPFIVLIGASMPSILVEISFITHPQEGRLLKTAPYRQRIAEALFEGIRGYQRSLKRAEATGGR
jgi:N-acetylmuramoyl-L-alanine amidase